MSALLETIRFRQDETHFYNLLIDGKWVAPPGKWLTVDNPATGQPVGQIPHCPNVVLQHAIHAAHEACSTMRQMEPVDRLEIFSRAKEILLSEKEAFVRLLVEEAGKPIAVAGSEVDATAERLRLTMEEARALYGECIPGGWVQDTVGKFAMVIRRPRGVIAAITSFNYPLFIPAAKIIPALLAGNTVVAKPSTKTPLTLLYFAKVLEAAGLPPGALNIVTGAGSEIGELLASNEKISMVSFTGSTEVGRRIARAASMKKLHLELGGKAAALILPDADLLKAAKACAKGAFRNSGQRCDAVSRVFVPEDLAEKFILLLLDQANHYPMGDPNDPRTQVGPLIDDRAVGWVDRLVQQAVSSGARVLLGGLSHGRFYEPTILDQVTSEMEIASEETFGPVIPILRYRQVEDAVDLANRSPYGLDSCLFTENLNQAVEIARQLEDGAVTINGPPAHGVGHFPFGGNKASGIGREGLGYTVHEMTTSQTVVFSIKEPRH